MKRTLLVGALSLSAVVGTLRAQTTISTLEAWTGIAQPTFGEPDAAYFGQTLTVPGDARLVSYEFRVAQLTEAPTQYLSTVYLWDTGNLRATGLPLYTSPASAFTGSGFAEVSFNLPGGGIDLATGQVILLMFDAIAPGDSVPSGSEFGLVFPGTLSGGEAFLLNSNSGANSPTTASWLPTDGDFAFKANFVFAPEPSTWGAVAAVAALVLWRLAALRSSRRSAQRV